MTEWISPWDFDDPLIEKISVELRGGPAHKKKSKVQLGSTGLRVPVLRRGGFEQVLYLPTGETNDYGEPIWQAEPPKP